MLKENLNHLRTAPVMNEWRKGGGKTVVAVFPFANETSEHIDPQLQAILSEAETWLVESNTVTVVARERQNQIIREIEGQQNAVFNPAHVAQYGKQLGAKYFVTGKVAVRRANRGHASRTVLPLHAGDRRRDRGHSLAAQGIRDQDDQVVGFGSVMNLRAATPRSNGAGRSLAHRLRWARASDAEDAHGARRWPATAGDRTGQRGARGRDRQGSAEGHQGRQRAPRARSREHPAVVDPVRAEPAGLRAADKAIDMLDLAHNAGDSIGEYVFSGSSGRYEAPPYEKLMINTLNMLNYLETRDLERRPDRGAAPERHAEVLSRTSSRRSRTRSSGSAACSPASPSRRAARSGRSAALLRRGARLRGLYDVSPSP